MKVKIPIKHSQINTLLIFVVLLLGLYILILPFLPEIEFWFKKHSSKEQPSYVVAASDPLNTPNDIPKDNRLVIPQIFLDMPILEGADINTAMNGLWRKPSTSTPEKDSNTVIVGHRFLYRQNKNSFYTLDKIKQGDIFSVYWQEKSYKYRVSEVKVVLPNQIEIEAPTEVPQITLYTCTPLWTADKRLVVVAKLIDDKGRAE